MFLLLLSIGISMEMKVASCIDISFIRMYINYSKKPNPDLKSILLTHPALKAIMRHQNLNGVVNVNIEDTFKMMTKNKPDIDYLIKALHKIEKNSELCDLWKISAKILPKNFKFVGRIYFVFGSDIGAASPPDIIINLGHTKFIEHPNEIEPYIIHEIHHIGFLAYQKMPSLTQLEIKENLLSMNYMLFLIISVLAVEVIILLQQKMMVFGMISSQEKNTREEGGILYLEA